MSKEYKFLLVITIIVLGTIWFLTVKKDHLREEEVSLVRTTFLQQKVKLCLEREGGQQEKQGSASIREKCHREAEKKWEEALILNDAN